MIQLKGVKIIGVKTEYEKYVEVWTGDVIFKNGSPTGGKYSLIERILVNLPDGIEEGYYNSDFERIEDDAVDPTTWLPTNILDQFVCATMDTDGEWLVLDTMKVVYNDDDCIWEAEGNCTIKPLHSVFKTYRDPLGARYAKFVRDVDGAWKRFNQN